MARAGAPREYATVGGLESVARGAPVPRNHGGRSSSLPRRRGAWPRDLAARMRNALLQNSEIAA